MTNEYKTNGISKMQKHKSLVVYVVCVLYYIITHIGDPAAKIYSEKEFVAGRWDNGTIFATKLEQKCHFMTKIMLEMPK